MKRLLVVICMLILANVAQAQTKDSAPVKPALLVIDVQNNYLPMMDCPNKEAVLGKINWMIHLFRQYGFPVIRVYHTDLKWGPKTDTDAFKFSDKIAINEEDPQIIKNYGNAFKKTMLDSILKESGVNSLFLTGLSATGCVLATYFGAVDHDYDTFMVKGTLLSGNAVHTEQIQDILNTVDYAALKLILKAAAK
ncbi:cysteine hydrolase [bacterium]|nr:cysteine hydrolase [bacterium]